MFNNYKKNKSKNLPKFERGGGSSSRAGVDNSRTMYGTEAGAYGSTMTTGQGGDATSTLYNEGRQSNIDAGQINQYAQIGTSVGAGATNVMGAYQNPESSYTDKYNSTAKAATGVTSAISPVWGAATQATYSIAAPIKNAMESSGENGRKASYIAGHIFDPLSTFATDAGTGTWSPKAYEKQYQAEHNPQGQFAMGGMNMQPNAEVELEENTLNPDGTATQFNGPTHEQGGIKTNLDPGTLIFSDKVKWDGKTAADHNKPYTRIIQKATKDLENSSLTKESKLSAHLNLMAATKASQAIFAKQEETKQSKIDSYTKRLGGIQKYPYGGELTTDLNAQQDPRFYNYQGSKMMVPNLKALGKDSGVAPDINLNNYNTLLNTRTQVRDSNVQMSKQLPKFEYINDPTKGDYNTQFENYKKVNVGYFRAGGQLPKFDEGDMFGYRPSNNVDKMKMYQMEKNKMNPQFAQYPTSNSSWITPEMLQNNSGNVEQSSTQAPVKKSTIDYSGYNQQAYNDELAKMNASIGNGDKSNWFNKNSDNLYQAGFGLAQNAGQLAYLSEQGKRYDTQQYHTYNPELLNDSAAMRDANEQTRRAEYNVRGASAGNAGTYLSNRVALNAQNIENKDKIRQQYANANAGIKNRANEVNLANRYSVDDINAKNKGAALNQYYKTIGSVGTNVAQGMKDNRQMGMDNENIQLMSEFYNSPEAQKMYAKYKEEKGIKSDKG